MSVDTQTLADALTAEGPFDIEIGSDYVDIVAPDTRELLETVSLTQRGAEWDQYVSDEDDPTELAVEILYTLKDVM